MQLRPEADHLRQHMTHRMRTDIVRLLRFPLQCLSQPRVVSGQLRQMAAAPEVHAAVTNAGIERAFVDDEHRDDRRAHT